MLRDIEVRLAAPDDRPALAAFYRSVYREDHPVHFDDWWTWQFGDPRSGRVVLAADGPTVVGHLGVCLAAGRGWTTLLHLVPEHRGRGLLREMYGLAGTLAALGATNSNDVSARLHRRHRWHELDPLHRYVAVRPAAPEPRWAPVDTVPDRFGPPPDAHYFRQPGLRAVGLADGSAGVLQPEVGGLRAVRLSDPVALLEEAWDAGIGWVDFVTSSNDPWCERLRDLGWQTDREAGVPWRLDPVVPDSWASISHFQADPVDRDLIVTREVGDHGRAGSRVLHR
jgi:hypothetical protein